MSVLALVEFTHCEYSSLTSFVDMNAVHASILRLGSGLSTNGGLASFQTVHPELVEGWFALLSSPPLRLLLCSARSCRTPVRG